LSTNYPQQLYIFGDIFLY